MSKRSRRSKRPSEWTSEEKLEVVITAASLSDEELGAFLRERGLHEAQLDEWRQAIRSVLDPGKPKKAGKKSPEAKQIKELRKELRRKDRALAEVTALLALKKKVQDLWGDEDDDTPEGSGR